MNSGWWVSAFLCILWIAEPYLVASSIHEYTNRRFILHKNAYVLFGGKEALTSDNETSTISFESIIFNRTEPSASNQDEHVTQPGLIQAVVFEEADSDKIGLRYFGLCCTPDVAKYAECKVGEVILRPSNDNPKWPKSINVSFQIKDAEICMAADPITVERTGTYSLYFITCDTNLRDAVINGRTVWHNDVAHSTY